MYVRSDCTSISHVKTNTFSFLPSICCLKGSLLRRLSFTLTAMRGDPEPDIDTACVPESKGEVEQTGALVCFLHVGMTWPTSVALSQQRSTVSTDSL